MELLLLALPMLLCGAVGIYWVGRRDPADARFLAVRLCALCGVLLAWCWAIVGVSASNGALPWRLLTYVPATGGLVGLVGLDLLRYRAGCAMARRSGHGAQPNGVSVNNDS